MGKEIIRTITEKCVLCYACVRNCPVKAVAIRNGKAEIIQERCIQCGSCVRICSQNAKEVQNGVQSVLDYIEKGNTLALIAPSFPAAFPDNAHKMAAALKSIGFSEVWEVASGAELVVQACQNLNNKEQTYIGSSCPSVINLIQKHYSQFISLLTPVVSPAIATARLIRHLHPDKAFNMVFIGPCIAKKGEIMQTPVKGEIQEAITYEELEEIFKIKKPDWDSLQEGLFDSPPASMAYIFPLSGGFLRNLNETNDIIKDENIVIEGFKSWHDILELIGQHDNSIRLVDGLFCDGCIDGPGMNRKDNIFARKASILKYLQSIPRHIRESGKKTLLGIHIDLQRSFEDLKVSLPQPGEDDIARILKMTNKESIKDQLNCGACGYTTCREKAVAVYQGIAEHGMCLPYLLSEKNELVKSLNEELAEVKRLKDEMDILIDASYDGVCMTDGQGIVQRVNKPLVELLGVGEEDLVGKNIDIIEKEKILYPSATLMVLNAKKAVTFLQQARSGKYVLATGNPVFDSQGNVTRVISNVRDFEKLQKIKDELDRVYNPPEVYKIAEDSSIIALSQAFNRVLSMALRVAIVDSTVLILGESGSGKDVVARYIHKNSSRSGGPFIKVNCGVFPESLIESELFGYETGAFTGAKKMGKQGLFEIAHGGTIFLDEIGELPLAQQVKLLHVIQEKQIKRIGSIHHQDIDVRILAATNRELTDMVKNGLFRADLYYRLNVVSITVPPLRERREDIIPLIYFFLEMFNKRYNKNCRISKDVKDVFLRYDWPGNIRELQNIVERLVVIAANETIKAQDLPSTFTPQGKPEGEMTAGGIMPLQQAIEEVEKRLIINAHRLYGSTYKIAEVLGVNQSTVVRKMKKYLNDANPD